MRSISRTPSGRSPRADEAPKAHNVYLSQQMLDIFIARSRPAPATRNTSCRRLRRRRAHVAGDVQPDHDGGGGAGQKEGLPLEAFTVHDPARTGSTLLNELGFNSDWIESVWRMRTGDPRGIYNKAEYEHQRRHMMQEWSNLVDAWVGWPKYTPTLYPPTMDLLTPEPDV